MEANAMEARYKTLKLVDLRAIAKNRGIKCVTIKRKADLIAEMVALDARETQDVAEAEEALKSGKIAAKIATKTAAEPLRVEKKDQTAGPEEDREKTADTGKTKKVQRRIKTHLDLGVEEEPADEIRHGGYSRTYHRRSEQNSYEARQEPDREPVRRPHEEGGHPFRGHKEEAGDEVSSQLAEQMSDADEACGILEIMPDGYGFLHTDNFLTGEDDAYVAPSQIRRFAMKTGDRVEGLKKRNNPSDKFAALLRINSVNGRNPDELRGRQAFENLTPIFPEERIRLERAGSSVASRVIDLISPIGKGQRGLIVSPPKAGKTTLLKEVAKSVQENHPEMHMMILLIDERPEEVTDMKETIRGENVEIIYSTFDQMPEHHTKVSEMVIERAKRLVEQGEDVIILLDSITRLARAYNLTVTSSGRILSGGLDPAALYMPKRFFGAARNMREGGSLTVLATALVDTGSRMDDVVYEEFKGTGNMELILDRRLSERRIFPAVDIVASGTRREDLLLDPEEMEAVRIMHRGINGKRAEENTEDLLNMFAHTKDNKDFIRQLLRHPIF